MSGLYLHVSLGPNPTRCNVLTPAESLHMPADHTFWDDLLRRTPCKEVAIKSAFVYTTISDNNNHTGKKTTVRYIEASEHYLDCYYQDKAIQQLYNYELWTHLSFFCSKTQSSPGASYLKSDTKFAVAPCTSVCLSRNSSSNMELSWSDRGSIVLIKRIKSIRCNWTSWC